MRGHLERRIWPAAPDQYGPPRYRRACEYETFIPFPLTGIDLTFPSDTAAVVSDAERAVANLNARARPELGPLARLLLRTESIASSKVEGLQVEARTLARAEARQDSGQRVGSQATDVLANIDAMQFAIEEAAVSPAIRPDGLMSIHRVLMEASSNPSIAGRLRNSQSWIGGNDYNPCGADFVPPPPDEVDELLLDLCRFCNEDVLPPLVQAGIAHAQFVTIHPFDDGNGRTGRALIHIVLRRRGLASEFVPPISVVFAENKDRYVKGLTAYREGDVTGWLELFATAAAQAAALAERHVTKAAGLQAEWRKKLREHVSTRSDAAAWLVIDNLPAHPVITVPVGVAVTGRTKPAVRNAFAELVDAGVLEPLTQSGSNRAWEAVGLLELIQDLETGSK